ncbi:5-oxoprolinase subunit B family protein [Dietzia sp.]|uniref:5-oxoprolinase subunit B family protein n=1 Tax=Dietzia sp. TaxID=1871616 RepID=UPI002FD8CE7A
MSTAPSELRPNRPFQVLPYGPTASLLELDSLTEVEDLFAFLCERRDAGELGGVVELVPAGRTVLISASNPSARASAVATCESWVPGTAKPEAGDHHEIPVVYDGPDLEDVARQLGGSTSDVIDLHSGARYRVAFMGFSPGFGYLTGLPEELHLPRRDDPREAVPPRSVAVAGEFSAVYPRTSPGGWNLLGRAAVPLWDEEWERPNLFAPGDTVTFVPEKGARA